MGANSKFSQFGFATRAVRAGSDIDKDSAAIKRPITMANSYALPYDPTDTNWPSAAGSLYTRNGGTTISLFNAWLIMRGSVTLPLRMRQHNENALAVARWLERQAMRQVGLP